MKTVLFVTPQAIL